jgi:putative transcriptional regulator
MPMAKQPIKGTLKNAVLGLRAAKGATQEDLARAIGATRQTVIAIEKGNYSPSVLLALRIAAYFRVPVEDIFKLSE